MHQLPLLSVIIEQVMKQQGYGPSADIWSFGCTLIEMATASHPYSEYTQVPSSFFSLFSSRIIVQVGAFFFDVLANEKRPTIPDGLSPLAQSFIELCINWYRRCPLHCLPYVTPSSGNRSTDRRPETFLAMRGWRIALPLTFGTTLDALHLS